MIGQYVNLLSQWAKDAIGRPLSWIRYRTQTHMLSFRRNSTEKGDSMVSGEPLPEAVEAIRLRLAKLEHTVDSTSTHRLFDFAERSFHIVLDADEHQDEKAGRILAAIAFLATAAAAIFARVYFDQTDAGLTRTLLGIPAKSWLAGAFLSFIILVVLGVIFYLLALGPTFNIPKDFQRGRRDITSLIFHKKIAEIDLQKWIDYWHEKTASAIQEEMTQNFIYESYLIAEKVESKVHLMRIGSSLFVVAMVVLIGFTIIAVFLGQ